MIGRWRSTTTITSNTYYYAIHSHRIKIRKEKKLQNEKGDLYRVTKNQSREGSAGLVRLHGNVSILRGNVCFDKKEMTNAYILSGSGQRKTSHAGHAFKFGKNRPTGRLKFRVGKKAQHVECMGEVFDKPCSSLFAG